MTTQHPDDPQVGVDAPSDEPVIDTPDVVTGEHPGPDASNAIVLSPSGAASTSPTGAPAETGTGLSISFGLFVAFCVTVSFALLASEDSVWSARAFSFLGGASSFYTASALIFVAFDGGSDGSWAARLIRGQDAHTFRPVVATALAASSFGIGICAALDFGVANSVGAWLLGLAASFVLLLLGSKK